MIWIVISVLIMTPKGFVRRLEELKIKGRGGPIQTPVLLKSARIPRKV